MSGKIIIGIDIGGSTTKIVGFDTSDGKRELIQPIFVKATDPITSVYGAFGKFLDSNSLTLEDIQKGYDNRRRLVVCVKVDIQPPVRKDSGV